MDISDIAVMLHSALRRTQEGTPIVVVLDLETAALDYYPYGEPLPRGLEAIWGPLYAPMDFVPLWDDADEAERAIGLESLAWRVLGVAIKRWREHAGDGPRA